MKRLIFGFIAATTIFSSINAQDTTFVFWAYPNAFIPIEDTTGVIDTIEVPIDVIIDDLNIFIGIDTHRLADLLIIDVISPWDDSVRLVYRNQDRNYLNVWFDTQDQEDGPGQLEDYNGHNSAGIWIIHVAQWTGHYNFLFGSWAIEVITHSTAVADSGGASLEFGMLSAFPNPSNSNVKFEFALSQAGLATLEVFNILGQKMATLMNDELPAGRHSSTWSASGVASGAYYYVLSSNGKKSQGRVTLVK
jgi:subtilisin-like proprotein convertase family protein